MRKSQAVIALLLLVATILASQTVYITRTGEKYHDAGCRYLAKSKISINLPEAVSRGFTPCSVCKPPANVEKSKVVASTIRPLVTSSAQDLYRVDLNGIDSSSEVDVLALLPAKVIRTVDGDTVTIEVSLTRPAKGLESRETIRLIGVDTPETVDPRKAVEAYGKEASAFTEANLLGEMVMLAVDWDLRDKYGRLLAYVYLTDGRCFNAELLTRGYAHAYLEYPFQFMEEFSGYEREAREAGIGLWKR